MLAYSAVVLLLALPLAYAGVPDIIVEVGTDRQIIDPGDPVRITGLVVDHGYGPLEGADVLVRIGSNTTLLTTDAAGTFGAEFSGAWGIPTTYTVNVAATWNNMSAITSTQFQVRGDLTPASALEERLSTKEAARYLGANASDFERDPIGMKLFAYYEGLRAELESVRKSSIKTPEQIHMEQERRLAEIMRRDAIKEFLPSDGTYGGYAYESYLSGLDKEVRGLVADQLNFTRNIFENAQDVRSAVIAAGGTHEEAAKAYLDALSTPREELEAFNRNATGGNPPKISTR